MNKTDARGFLPKNSRNGEIYGRWEIVEFSHRNKWKQAVYRCRCSCGTIRDVSINTLQQKWSRSCGCLRSEVSRKSGVERKRHVRVAPIRKLHTDPTYKAWCGMKQRCLNPNSSSYRLYGGRGVLVCDDWLVWDNFYRDMGDKPKGLTLDRIDSYGDYCPKNCRWATWKQQASNRRPKQNKIKIPRSPESKLRKKEIKWKRYIESFLRDLPSSAY